MIVVAAAWLAIPVAVRPFLGVIGWAAVFLPKIHVQCVQTFLQRKTDQTRWKDIYNVHDRLQEGPSKGLRPESVDFTVNGRDLLERYHRHYNVCPPQSSSICFPCHW